MRIKWTEVLGLGPGPEISKDIFYFGNIISTICPIVEYMSIAAGLTTLCLHEHLHLCFFLSLQFTLERHLVKSQSYKLPTLPEGEVKLAPSFDCIRREAAPAFNHNQKQKQAGQVFLLFQ